MRPPDCDALIPKLSREIALVCTPDGAITWMDERAEAVLGTPCARLADRALPGTERKVVLLVGAASTEQVSGLELSLSIGGRAETYSFCGEPCSGGALLVGARVSAGDVNAFEKMSAAMTELAELHRKAEQQRRELADSNRALIAMHAELAENTHVFRRLSEVKSRLVANVSHELRTPISSILGYSQLLLDHTDGDLTREQESQVRLVKTSAEVLASLINDVLDLTRLEAGRQELRASNVTTEDLFSSLRGMMKPLAKSGVEMVVEDPPAIEPLHTDAGKVAQILRNLVSNAMKFTERGEVRIRAREPRPGIVRFEVADTGIGIGPEDQERIFEEFAQVDSDIQRRVRGSGLGLSLSRKLAQRLGGKLTVVSARGVGSTFSLEIPRVHEEVAAVERIEKRNEVIDPSRPQVLLVEDNRQLLFFYDTYLSDAGFQVLPARTPDEARRELARVRPAAIVLDVLLEGEASWGFLRELKTDATTCDIPVMVLTAIECEARARALGADEFWLKPIDGDRLVRQLITLAKREPITRILAIDDDAAARYLLRRSLEGTLYTLLEAAGASEGLRVARVEKPDVIFLDLVLGEATAFDVIDDLAADPETRSIPIVVLTDKTLDEAERSRLDRRGFAILRKEGLSRDLIVTRIRQALEAAKRTSLGGA